MKNKSFDCVEKCRYPEAVSACLSFAAHAIKNEIYLELKAA
jgi:hypothetical protein